MKVVPVRSANILRKLIRSRGNYVAIFHVQRVIRQTVQNTRYFTRTLRGHYRAAAA